MSVGRKTAGVLLAVLLVVSWGACLLGIGADDKAGKKQADYSACIALAEDYMQRGLYQKAALEYDAAIALQNREADWQKLLEARRLRREENENSVNKYLEDAKRAANAYPENVDFCLTVARLSIEQGDYKTAFRFLQQTRAAAETDEAFEQLYRRVQYSYTIKRQTYLGLRSFVNGSLCVSQSGAWGAIKADGSQYISCTYTMMGPVSREGYFVYTNGGNGIIADVSGIIQGKMPCAAEDAGVYSDGLVPVCSGSEWAYYNLLGDYQFGAYLSAGTFQDGKAAVETEQGWFLVDTGGNVVQGISAEEIKLNGDGSYLTQGVIQARKDGVYRLYDKNWKEIGDFSCEDMDIAATAEGIAFQQGGKWGFVDREGNVLIQPQYENAKSFSNGFAAVCVDGKWGFINTENQLVIACDYLDAGYFTSAGSCMVNTVGDTWQMLTLNIWE